MGSINYKTSDYITLSIKPYDEDDIDIVDMLYNCDKENAQSYIDKYNLYYFHVAIEPGYYEGLSIDIENNFPVCFDNYNEKKEAQKEVTQLKQLLFNLAGVGYVQTFPGWVTGYNDYKNTLKGIKKAIKDIRQEVATTPTYRDYIADRHYKNM